MNPVQSEYAKTLQTEEKKNFLCPGESHPISHAIHLARLTACYEACRECPHRHETTSLSPQTRKQVEQSFQRIHPETFIRGSGFRGLYLNQFNSETVTQFGHAIANWFWNRQPHLTRAIPKNKKNAHSESIRMGRSQPPTLLLGCDERPHSPVLVRQLGQTLKQAGCHIIETGILTRACFSFATHHLQAAGGIYITGEGAGPECTGFDIIGQGAIPLSTIEQKEIEQKTETVNSPVTRNAGEIRVFHPEPPYEAILGKHFHALRPLKICCGLSSNRLAALLERLFIDLPCNLILKKIPIRKSIGSLPDEVLIEALSEEIIKNKADLGMLTSENGELCWFLDEQGRLVQLADLACLLMEQRLKIVPDEKIVAHEQILPQQQFDQFQKKRAESVLLISENRNSVPVRMEIEQSGMGISKCGRIWFHDSFPQADSIVTLALILQKLSQSDDPFSSVISDCHVSR